MPELVRIKKHPMTWEPSQDPSVVKQRVYVVFGDSLPADAQPVLNDVDKTVNSLIIPDDFPEGTFAQEGIYVIGVGSVDGSGNERIIWTTHPFDFTAPAGITNLQIG